MKVNVIDEKGKKIEELKLDNGIFGQDSNPDLLAQYVHVYRTNQRQGSSSIKTRAEVSGGGRKPWRQKGTGRARHGSIRSPIWVHGGIAHGPKPKDYSLSLPKKMRKKAMLNALSYKAREKMIKVIDKMNMTKPSTKRMKKLLDDMKLSEHTLLVTEEPDINIQKSAANLSKVKVVFVDNLNVYNVLEAENILFEKNALLKLQKRYK